MNALGGTGLVVALYDDAVGYFMYGWIILCADLIGESKSAGINASYI